MIRLFPSASPRIQQSSMAYDCVTALSQQAGLTHYAGVPAFGLLRHASRVIPDHAALSHRDRTWTYEQLNHDVVRCAAMLQSLGVDTGDRVGLLLPNVPEFVIALNGIWRCGGIGVALSPLMVKEEVESLIEATDCRVIVCLDLLSGLLPDPQRTAHQRLHVSLRDHLHPWERVGYMWALHRRTGHWTLSSDHRTRWFWDELQACRREWEPVPICPETDAAYVIPTGGTTGHPKAVTLSHRNLVANAWQQYAWTRGSFAAERILAVLPFFHSYGLSATLMAGAAMGATLTLQHRFNVLQVIRAIERDRITVLHAVPAMLIALNERLRRQPADLCSLKWVISGGASLDEAVAREFAGHSGALVVEGYGLSEASPVTHVGPLFESPDYGSIGLPLPETECRIKHRNDATGKTMADEVGELQIRGPQIMLGYWQDPDSTRQVIEDGWLSTGDLAVCDRTGRYRIVGRTKDLIITSGFNVYPNEVESVLRQAPKVADVAIVGEPDERCGEVVKAFVVLQPGAEWDEAGLRDYCNEHLAKHKRPRMFQRCDGDLPRNFLGKVVRRHLREQILDGLEEVKS